ncbi:spore cortex biosynthesis protein YabQ [Mangrovibacillus sp. Mu-81]|uniref:spore cortex biosynthesis protein YabQ n=1 Tax=Mangrovibacillus sp. Mu-81 TaxID=3121478 RepID=UPI002FE4A296
MTLTTQFYTMLSMIGMGALFGATLDTYNRFLNRSQRRRWLVFLNDLLFWVLQALAIFYILFSVNFGELRFYIFIALLCGFAGYQALLKQGFLHLLEKLILFFISLYNLLVSMVKKLVYSPIKWLVVLLITLVLSLAKGLLKTVIFLLKMVYSIVRWAIMLVLRPVWWIVKGIWNLLPNHLTKRVEKLYNKMAGILEVNIKKIYRVADKVKTRFKK